MTEQEKEYRAALDRAKKGMAGKLFRTHGWLHTKATSNGSKAPPRDRMGVR